MAELALEYIVKITILIVAAVVIIGLILTFSQDIHQWWTDFMGSEQKSPPEAIVIEKSSFTAKEVANFIEGCWSSNEGSQQDNECYFLLGGFSGVDENSIVSAVNANIIDPGKIIFDFDTVTNALVITYDNYRSEAGSEAIVIKGR